jgi:ribosome biogenesis protein BMS1
MIDISKIVDIVLLMIDGNFGFEMETMEFLNILASSGMPGNVFGILTHLDLFRRPSTLKQAKKRLKHRFWSELYQGAKLFYLSGVINGRYPDREVHNLSRFLSVMKNPRPLVWRNTHPYCLADRFLDLTPPTIIEENPKCDRTISLYGYLRGTNFPAQGARVHVPGVGDLTVSMMEALPDPCPTPFMDQAMAKATGKKGRRRLGEKQKVLFAPMSDVGGVLVDKDAVYIDVKTSNFDKDAEEDEHRGLGERMVVGLQGERRLLGEADEGVQLFSGGEALSRVDERDGEGDMGRKERRKARFVEKENGQDEGLEDEVVDCEDDDDADEGFVSEQDDEDDDGYIEDADIQPAKPGWSFRKEADLSANMHREDGFQFAETDSDLGSASSAGELLLSDGEELSEESENSEDDGATRWKKNLTENARKLHGHNPRYRTADLARLIYDESLTPAEVIRRWSGKDGSDKDGDESDEELFFKRAKNDEDQDMEFRTIPMFDHAALAKKWTDEANLESLRHRFITADLLMEKHYNGENNDSDFEGIEDGIEGDEGDGEFEDLETGEKHPGAQVSIDEQTESVEAEREKNARKKEELRLRFEEEDREGFNNDKANERRENGQAGNDQFGEDDWYDAQKARIQKQMSINRAEFEQLDGQSRIRVEGYKAGTYARIVLESVPYEFATTFNPRYPIVVGGLTPTEDRFGFIQVRIKRHRWHKEILKTNDPLIFSLGWRRFQTLPIYSISDSRTRNRMLKYTPEHMHCFGTFYGPLIAPNTGFCCVQSFSNKNPGFRIAATGVVLNVDESTEIVKKLKLTGTPTKIFRNTAFIKDMFTSALEIAKFEGASIRTVSGIRGQIKRALSKPEGHFRATFEDKILMSDIAFLRAWYPVHPHRFYNPVTNLLESPGGREADSGESKGWKGMRLTGEVRRDQGIQTPKQKNSQYRVRVLATHH